MVVSQWGAAPCPRAGAQADHREPVGALPCGCPHHARPPHRHRRVLALPRGWLFPGECAGARRGRAKAAKTLLSEGEVGGGESRGDQRREEDVEKKQKRTSWATLVLVEVQKRGR